MTPPYLQRQQIAPKADGSTADLGNIPITLDELEIDGYPVSGSRAEGQYTDAFELVNRD